MPDTTTTTTGPGVPLAAIGVHIGYYAGTKGTKPTSTTTFTRIYDLKTTSELNPAPNTADASTFDNEEFTTYVELLKDIGGSISFNANLTAEFKSAWESAVSASATNGGLWFAIDIPGLTESLCVFGKPSKLGLPALTSNSLMEATVYITPITEPEWISGVTVS